METVPFHFKQPNRFLPHIACVGLGIGTANYLINGDLNWFQWVIQSIVTSVLIGYTLVSIGSNKSWLKIYFKTNIKIYIFIFLAFFLAGVLATEIEHIMRALVFHSQQFQLFSSGKMYVFNGIISLVLGFGFFQNDFSKHKNPKNVQSHKHEQNTNKQNDKFLEATDSITSIPVKQGENIFLVPIENVTYFEAYDNYSFVHDIFGEKKLCDYSLRFLEIRLSKNFSRVHRKYIVNEKHIKQIKPHLNGRYLIVLNNESGTITSSKSYSTIIRKLIKIE